ncbi:MAG: hypothetical protein J7604_19685 [Sporocytophaga sp.]|uniref:hypothetical protein n=1 Tax=Sporocytophaga sp. TaxID=2231183 RepID=UPI001B206428|nr:hypothetical protein [Sporocytophaga sp.]MBO9702442.1 hypothetical protein [Sporocytophaga sp.]
MKQFLFFILVIILLSCSGSDKPLFENSNDKQATNSLLIAEFGEIQGELYESLVKYNFLNGELSSKDTILVTPSFKNGKRYVRYDCMGDTNFILKNNYVITGCGDVIDLSSDSVLTSSKDDFIEGRGDSLIFFRRNDMTGTGYLLCDLKKKTYGVIKDPNYRKVKGILSPNHKHGLEVVTNASGNKILIYDSLNVKKEVVRYCGNPLLDESSSFAPITPVFWIDNENFIYPDYLKPLSQQGKFTTAEIKKINIKLNTIETIVRIDSIKETIHPSTIYQNNNGNLVLDSEDQIFVIDLVHHKYYKTEYMYLGSGFEIQRLEKQRSNLGKSSIIKYQGKEIGKLLIDYYKAIASDGFICVENGAPRSIKVWNNISHKWTTISVSAFSIVGWVK